MHTTSSPEFPKSNGAAERAVQTAKRILKKADADGKDPFEGLLKFRSTPFDDIGVSPSQLLMGRRTRTTLPTHRRLLLPQHVEPQRVVKALKARQDKSKALYDEKGKDLPQLEAGDKVRIRPGSDKLWRKAEVLPRSYVVKDERGRVYRRNRQQIISTPQDLPMKPEQMPKIVNHPFQHRASTETFSHPPTGPAVSFSEPPDSSRTSPVTTRSGRTVRKPQRFIETV